MNDITDFGKFMDIMQISSLTVMFNKISSLNASVSIYIFIYRTLFTEHTQTEQNQNGI